MVRWSTVLFSELVMLATLVGCGSKTLSRAKAQDVIQADGRLKQPRTYPFIISKEKPSGNSLFDLKPPSRQ
jgi:hypothetical protein